MRAVRLLVCGLLLQSLVIGAAWANPVDLYGIGPRATAMAGAYAALADDFSAAFYNPAGLYQVQGKHTGSFGYMRSFPNLGLSLQAAPGASSFERRRLHELERQVTDPEPAEAWVGGMTLNFFDRSYFGCAIHVPTKWLNRNRSYEATVPRYFLWYNYAQLLKPFFGFSIKIIDGLAVGGGFALYEDVAGNVKLPLVFDNSNFGENPSNLEGGVAPHIDVNLSQPIDLQATAGVHWGPSRYFRSGLSYRQAYALEARLNIEADIQLKSLAIDMELLRDLLPYSLDVVLDIPGLGATKVPVRISDLQGELIVDAHIPINVEMIFSEMWTPQELTWGVASDPLRCLTLSFDMTWYDWSEFVPPGTAFVIDDVRVNGRLLPSVVSALVDVSLPVIGVVSLPLDVNMAETPFELTIPFAAPTLPKPRMRDVWVPRLGAEYRLPRLRPLGRDLDLALRGGYAYIQSPIEAQSGSTNLFDNDRHLICGGFGASLMQTFALDASVQWHKLVERVEEKTYPDPYYGFVRAKTGGDVLAVNVGLSVRF